MYSGVGVSTGVISGKLCFCKNSLHTYEKKRIQNVVLEQEYVKQAFLSVKDELKNLYELAKERVGLTVAMIVQGHGLILEDKSNLIQIQEMIEAKSVNAEWAIQEVFEQYIHAMNQSEDTYLKARAADLKDLLNRLEEAVQKIKGIQQLKQVSDSPVEAFIAIGRQFSVEDILTLYENGAVGVLDLSGDEESHAVVIAKSLNLPMIIQVNEDSLNLAGRNCRMDGASGSVQAE